MSTTIEGVHYRTGQKISVDMDNGRISAITYDTDKSAGQVPLVAPGFVDLQINGYLGMDFNNGNLKEETVSDISTAIVRTGVTSFYPTVITNTDEAIAQELSTIARSMERDLFTGCIAGIHLEGPFISPESGAVGAHSKDCVKAPDWYLFQKWQEAALGRIKIVTMSPEWPSSMNFIEKCVASGVTVSIGHTAADSETIRDAVTAGARMSTHLGNGSHLMLPRHSNYVYEQLANDDLWACFIADGFHLPRSFLKIGLRAKGHKAMIVSDAVALSGMPAGDYETAVGGKVTLTSDGKLHLASNDKILAGSAQMLISGVANLVNNGLATLPDAWDMASTRPASVMDLPSKDGLVVGAPADLVSFRWNGTKIEICKTFKQGHLVFGA